MPRLGEENDGGDHNYRQRIDNVYQIRADKKKELHGKFPLLLVRPSSARAPFSCNRAPSSLAGAVLWLTRCLRRTGRALR